MGSGFRISDFKFRISDRGIRILEVSFARTGTRRGDLCHSVKSEIPNSKSPISRRLPYPKPCALRQCTERFLTLPQRANSITSVSSRACPRLAFVRANYGAPGNALATRAAPGSDSAAPLDESPDCAGRSGEGAGYGRPDSGIVETGGCESALAGIRARRRRRRACDHGTLEKRTAARYSRNQGGNREDREARVRWRVHSSSASRLRGRSQSDGSRQRRSRSL